MANLPLKLSGDPAYIYAVGRVRVREKRLLSSRQLNEAAEATSLGAAIEALREAGYESFGGSREGLELMLDGQHESLRRFLLESIPTGALTRFLLISTDYANLKAALVTQLSGRPSPLVNGGLTDPSRFRGLIDGGEPDDLPDEITKGRSAVPVSGRSLEELEKRHILDLLTQCGGNQSRVARILGISRRTVYRKLKSWGVLSDDV